MRRRRWLVVAPTLLGLCACGTQSASTAAAPSSVPPPPKTILYNTGQPIAAPPASQVVQG